MDVKSPDKDCEKKENETVDNNNPEKTTNTNQDVNVSGHDEADINEPEPESTQAQVQNQPSDDLEPICTHPVYRKYFKMLHVGVVKHAVKLKMAQEGLDPSLLE